MAELAEILESADPWVVRWLTEPKDEYSWPEVKEISGFDESLLQELRRDGNLIVTKRAGRRYVKRDDMERFLFTNPRAQAPPHCIIKALPFIHGRITLEAETFRAALAPVESVATIMAEAQRRWS